MLYPIVLETADSGAVSAYAPGLPVYAVAETYAKSERAIRAVLPGARPQGTEDAVQISHGIHGIHGSDPCAARRRVDVRPRGRDVEPTGKEPLEMRWFLPGGIDARLGAGRAERRAASVLRG